MLIKRFSSIAGTFIALSSLAFSHAQASQDTTSYIRVVEQGSQIRLEVASKHFVPSDEAAPTVDLVGAVHLADPSFYTMIQDQLDTHDLVLFEGVKPMGAGDLAQGEVVMGHAIDPIVATSRRLRFLATMIEANRRTEDAYPDSINDFVANAEQRISWLVHSNRTDAWGHELIYKREKGDGFWAFDIVSLGADNKPGGIGDNADLRFSDQARPDINELGLSEVRSLQEEMGQAMGLTFQLDGVDWNRPRWRNSDLSIDQVMDLLGSGPVSFKQENKGEEHELFEMLQGGGVSAKIMKLMFTFIKRSSVGQTVVKVLLMDMLAQADELMTMMPGDAAKLMDVIINDRNQAVLYDLDLVDRFEPEVKSIAIWYGAGHLQAMEKQLVDDLGYKPDGITWVPAISVDLSEMGEHEATLRMVRTTFNRMIEQQIKMMKMMDK